jgi:cell division protein FtsQ
VLGKIAALASLILATSLLYHLLSSDAYGITAVRVSGATLSSPAEVEQAAGVRGRNVFGLDRREVVDRLRVLPTIADADARLMPPDVLELRVFERAPFALWRTGGQAFQVDGEGRVLTARPPAGPLLTVVDVDDQPVRPGERVSGEALRTADALRRLLPERLGFTPTEFEYSRRLGIVTQSDFGPKLRFGAGEQLEAKLDALLAVRAHLEATRTRATVIDVRVPDRPFYR